MANELPTPILVEFHYFKKLPLELRLKIWRATIPTDRVVAITDQRQRLTTSANLAQFHAKFSARYTIPPSIQTCTESRHEILKSYTPILASHLGRVAIPFNFDHDTLLMDGPEGTITLWSFEKACRKTEEGSAELHMIHQKLKHLVVHGQRLNNSNMNEVQGYLNLETLVLPKNAFWNSPMGADAFEERIGERLKLQWTMWKLSAREDRPLAGALALPDGFTANPYDGQWVTAPPLSTFPGYLNAVENDTNNYSLINCATQISFLTEQEMQARYSHSTWLTLSYIDHPSHPALKRASQVQNALASLLKLAQIELFDAQGFIRAPDDDRPGRIPSHLLMSNLAKKHLAREARDYRACTINPSFRAIKRTLPEIWEELVHEERPSVAGEHVVERDARSTNGRTTQGSWAHHLISGKPFSMLDGCESMDDVVDISDQARVELKDAYPVAKDMLPSLRFDYTIFSNYQLEKNVKDKFVKEFLAIRAARDAKCAADTSRLVDLAAAAAAESAEATPRDGDVDDMAMA